MVGSGSPRMRVALAGPYPLSEKIRGGVEGVNAVLASALARIPDIDLHIITAAHDGRPTQSVDGAKLTVLPESRRFRRMTFYWLERRRLVRCLRELRPDVVHVQGQNWYALAALSAGFPTVVTLHGMINKEKQISDGRTALLDSASRWARFFFNARYEEETLRRAKHIILISPYVEVSIAGRTVAKLYPAANPIDDRFFEIDSEEAQGRLLFVGFVEPRKGVDVAIHCILSLAERYPDLTLHIAGGEVDRGYARAVRGLVERYGLQKKVRFLGHLDQARLLEEYRQCCALLLTSQEEASPLAVQQAMAAGKPVIATRAGGTPHLVEDGVTGFLAGIGDVDGLVAHLDAVLQDRSLRERLGESARRRAYASFRAGSVARQTREIYERVLEQPSSIAFIDRPV